MPTPQKGINEAGATTTNEKWWDERAELHLGSHFYNTQSLIDGSIRLNDYELKEVGDVTGKKLVHLQCHLGTETIGWARLGAEVTGIDFSDKTIKCAKRLAKQCGVTIRYVRANIYDSPEAVGKNNFDIVYSNIGSLHWLPDIYRWAKVVEELLIPGGILYINEIHPVSNVLSEEEPTFLRDYFDRDPVVWNEKGSYADVVTETVDNQHIIWDRPLSDIINSIIQSGLVISSIQERPGQEFQQFSYQQQREDGKWYNPEGMGIHPSTFSLRALKKY